jgi:glutathione S-transferase
MGAGATPVGFPQPRRRQCHEALWGPHTCAVGIHILLEEIDRPYETEKLDVNGGDTHRLPFIGINPKGKVPTLVREDGSVLTEFSAIATWLARTNPQTGLLPDDLELEARAVETMAYVGGTIHGQGYARVFVPQMFARQDVAGEGRAWAGIRQATGARDGRNGFRAPEPATRPA